MNEQEQRIAIAMAVGWTEVECTAYGKPGFVAKTPEGEILWRGESGYSKGDAVAGNCPDYLNDLTAMHEAEKILTEDQRPAYIRALHFHSTGAGFRSTWEADWKILHATSSQRAEAFLRTLGLWKESA